MVTKGGFSGGDDSGTDSGSDSGSDDTTDPADPADNPYAGGVRGTDPDPDPDPTPPRGQPTPTDDTTDPADPADNPYAGGVRGTDPDPDPGPELDPGAETSPDVPGALPGDLPSGTDPDPQPDPTPPRGQPTPTDAGAENLQPGYRDLYLDRADDPDQDFLTPGLEDDPDRVEDIDQDYQFDGTTAGGYVSQRREELTDAGYEPDEFSIRFDEERGLYVEYDEELLDARQRDELRQEAASELDAFGVEDIGVREVQQDGETVLDPFVTDAALEDYEAEQVEEQRRDLADELGISPQDVEMREVGPEPGEPRRPGMDPGAVMRPDVTREGEISLLADQLDVDESDLQTDETTGEIGLTPDAEREMVAEREGVDPDQLERDPETGDFTYTTTEVQREEGGLTAPGIVEGIGGAIGANVDAAADVLQDVEDAAIGREDTAIERGEDIAAGLRDVGGDVVSTVAGVIPEPAESDISDGIGGGPGPAPGTGDADIEDDTDVPDTSPPAGWTPPRAPDPENAQDPEVSGDELVDRGVDVADAGVATAADVAAGAKTVGGDVYSALDLYEDDEVLTGTPPGVATGPGGAAQAATRTPGAFSRVTRYGDRIADTAIDARNVVAGAGIGGGFVVGAQQDGAEEETVPEDVVYDRPEIDVPDRPVGSATGEIPIPEQDVGITAPEVGVPEGDAVGGTAELPVPEGDVTDGRGEVPVPEQGDPTGIRTGGVVDPVLRREEERTRDQTLIEQEFGDQEITDRYREDIDRFEQFAPDPLGREILRDEPSREYLYERDIDPRVVEPEPTGFGTPGGELFDPVISEPSLGYGTGVSGPRPLGVGGVEPTSTDAEQALEPELTWDAAIGTQQPAQDETAAEATGQMDVTAQAQATDVMMDPLGTTVPAMGSPTPTDAAMDVGMPGETVNPFEVGFGMSPSQSGRVGMGGMPPMPEGDAGLGGGDVSIEQETIQNPIATATDVLGVGAFASPDDDDDDEEPQIGGHLL